MAASQVLAFRMDSLSFTLKRCNSGHGLNKSFQHFDREPYHKELENWNFSWSASLTIVLNQHSEELNELLLLLRHVVGVLLGPADNMMEGDQVLEHLPRLLSP